MDTEGGNGNAPSRPPGAGTKRGHQTAKEDAPIAKNPKHTDFEVVTVVESTSEFLPYYMDMLPHLYELGAALGVFKFAETIINDHDKPQMKCIQILEHWLNGMLRPPTWEFLCQKLRVVPSFQAVVHKIARDHNLPTAGLDDRPKEKDLLHIALAVSGKWRFVLAALGLKENSIQTLWEKSLGRTQDACFSGLVVWMLGNGVEPVSWRTLFDCLRNLDLRKEIQDLSKKCNLVVEEPDLSSEGNLDVTVVKSVSDLMPYYMDMLANLSELGAVLGVDVFAKAIIDGFDIPQSKCLRILSHWLGTMRRPTWALLCQKLRLASPFYEVVGKITRDHLNAGLAAKIEDEGEEEAFIPPALPFKHSLVTSVATICFTLEFPSGARKSRVRANVTEIPRGIFPRLIVYLLSPQCLKEFKWQVDKGDSRSRIKLTHPSYEYTIYLSEHVDYIELDLVLNDPFLPTLHNVDMCTTKAVGSLCQGLRKHLVSALGDTFVSVFGKQPPERMPSVVCGLKCSACPESSHMAIVLPAEKSTPQHPRYTWKCVHEPRLQSVKKPEQLIWFSPEKEATFKKKKTHDQDGRQWMIWVMEGTDADLLLPDDSSTPSSPTPPPPTWKKQYVKAIKQRASVTLHITRCVLIGPPRVGKSSLKLLLINNEPPDKEVEKSTDLMEAPVVLTSIQCQDKKGSQWKELTTNSLQQLVIKCTREEEYDPAKLNSIQSSHASQLTSEGSISHISIAAASHTDILSTTVTESSSTSMHLADSELEGMYHHFVGATMSEESLAKLEMNGLKMVHVFDCGGQLAFQDTIPLLINAPCAFISVFNASIDLDEEVELKYCPEKGVELSLGHKESQWNMLRRIFSSIHSLQFKCHDDIKHLIASEQEDTEVVLSSPIAVVGTHKDLLCKASQKYASSDIKKIKERLEQLRESKLYDFLRKGCRTLDLVTNISKDDLSAIESLRKDIVESKATLSLELPLSWIILELFTRSLENKFIPFHDLQQLCICNNIVRDKEEFLSLLQVLHALGFYAFYQLDGVPEDQNWVCTDAATLYREVTKILVVQRCKEPENLKEITTTLQQYGRIPLKEAAILKDLFTDLQINIGEAKPKWFMRVLLHIGLAVKIKNEGFEEVFIPLTLPFKRSDFSPVTSAATICFSLEFPSGASEGRVCAKVIEIPRGIFPRLIVYLLSQQRLGEFQWLVDKGDSRSQIKLTHHSYEYVIYLSEHVDHIELDLVLNDTFLPTLDNVMPCTTEVGHLCQGLREHFISALRNTFVSVFGEQLPERKPSVVCGFICSSCRDSSCHMAIVQLAKGATAQLYTEKCVHKRFPRIVEKPDQLIWFSPEKETAFEKETIEDQDGQWTIWVMKWTGVLKSDLANRPSAKDLRDISHKTGENSKDLLRSLEIEEAQIATFVMNNPHDIAEACYQGLLLWENENALLPVTWGTLKAALKKAKLTKLANMLPPKEK